MKKINLLFAALAFVFVAGGTQAAQAEVQAPLWNCALTFDIQGGGLKVLVGHYKLEGYGQVSCTDIVGNTEQIPVYVRMGGKPLSLGVGIGSLRLIGLASGIGISGSPSDLLGGYLVAGARGSLILGGGLDLALRASSGAVTFNTSIQAVSGIGANIVLDYLTIQAL